jgi:putative transposase
MNLSIPGVIRFHNDTIHHNHWIGVDLNTTGHAVVAADRRSGKILKLGKNIHCRGRTIIKNYTKHSRENKLWKFRRIKTREKKEFRVALQKIARQIVNFAESVCAGIKFERLFSGRNLQRSAMDDSYEFSFENGSFMTLLYLVERRALTRGIPVQYVNPANTSKRCCRCGGIGRRMRKRFECPHCGTIIHADVNAAFNIADVSGQWEKAEIHRIRAIRRRVRKLVREGMIYPENTGAPDLSCHRNALSRWNDPQMIPNPV